MFPTPFEVQTRKFREGPDRTPRGALVESWDAPVTQKVMGWNAPQTPNLEKSHVLGHDRVLIELELLVPPEFEAGPRDRVIIPSMGTMPAAEYSVVGYPENFCFGPFGFKPGSVVNLTRAEG